MSLSIAIAGLGQVAPKSQPSPQAAGRNHVDCSAEEIDRAEHDVDHLKDWNAVYRWSKAFDKCELADAQEGYSEAVARLLVDHWNTLNLLFEIQKRHPSFRAEVDATMGFDDLIKIKRNARHRCPVGKAAFCKDLARGVDEALAEIKAVSESAPVFVPKKVPPR